MTLTSRPSFLLAAGFPMLLAMPAAAQSFNCHKAFFADEKTICAQPALRRLDSDLASLFGHVISRLPPPERASLTREETGWVVARRGCGDNAGCIADFYQRRIRELDAVLAANESEGLGGIVRQSMRTRTQPEPARPELMSAGRVQTPMTPQAHRRLEAKPPAVVSAKIPSHSDTGSSSIPASGSAAPAPSTDFSVEPEVSPAARSSFGASAGGPMTPDR